MLSLGIVILFCALASGQISNQTEPTTVCPACDTSDSLLRIGTFNTLQIPHSKHRDERFEAILNFLSSDSIVDSLDMLCLQELWSPQRRQQLVETVLPKFPHSYMAPSFGKCNATSDAEEMEGDCIYRFGGNSDVVILSAHPFLETNFAFFSNSADAKTATTALHAKIQFNNSTVHFFCTHIQPTNEEVIQGQIEETIEFVSQRTNPGEFVAIAGDYNVGPKLEGIEGQHADSYDYFLENGYESAFALFTDPPVCTYCGKSNPLTKGNDNLLLDHIFVLQNVTACTAATGLFATEDIVDVGDKNIPLSDHYGVYTVYCIGDRAPQPEPIVDVPEGINSGVERFVPIAGVLLGVIAFIVNQ